MRNQIAGNNSREDDDAAVDESEVIRDIHALTPPQPNYPPSLSSTRTRRREAWETGSHRSVGSEVSSEGFTTMSREFNAMVVAGSTMQNNNGEGGDGGNSGANLGRIGEEELEETNPLAIVPDMNPVASPRRAVGSGGAGMGDGRVEEVSVQRVKKEEVESKISAWKTAKIAKINNRFKREDVVINGWESAQVEKATTTLSKIERKLDEQRAKAVEKMQNDVAKARRKAEDKRASAEAKRGTKVARVLDLANLMKAVGRAPSKRSFF